MLAKIKYRNFNYFEMAHKAIQDNWNIRRTQYIYPSDFTNILFYIKI